MLLTLASFYNTVSFPNNIPWCRHHGKYRLPDSSELNNVLVVLTTYHTVMAEWRSGAGTNRSVFFKPKWKRIILDESLLKTNEIPTKWLIEDLIAHFIRNTDSQMARAICSLDSVSRWAVTGTPIQNKLGDLAALLKFLKFHPYSEKRQFETDVSNLWKSGHIEKAVERLKRLSTCLILCRPKETIQLPPRQDLQYTVEFTQAERRLYEDVRSQVISHIDEAILQRDKSNRSDSFINVLQRIEAMRMVCDLGVYYPSRHEMFNFRGQPEEDWRAEAQRAFNLRREMSPIECEWCRSSLDTIDDVLNESTQPRTSLFSRCLAFLCYTCSQKRTSDTGFCRHEPPCAVASISTDSFMTEDPSPILRSHIGM
jgi:SWI/SNF-related matrix-associated actin-dependent regulator of chromatin subfamily A3